MRLKRSPRKLAASNRRVPRHADAFRDWNGAALPAPLRLEEIAILYPAVREKDKPAFDHLQAELKRERLRHVWLSDKSKRSNRQLVHAPGLKIQTIQSAKGLQYRAVLLLWIDVLPIKGEPLDQQRLELYVALTRAEDFLAILRSGASGFVAELRVAASG